MITILFLMWAAWIVSHVVLMLLVHPKTLPYYSGFAIHMPEHLFDVLTFEEWMGVYYHEKGHQHHGHVWKNLLRVCFFSPASRSERVRQELEADEYSLKAGYGPGLASALRKLAPESMIDSQRATRLEMRVVSERAACAV